MKNQYPKRPNSHNLESLSERYFGNALPQNWVMHKPPNDYGVDLIVDIFEGELATGLELLVQLKSSQKASEGDSESITLPLSTYNYLWGKLQVVMLVKFVADANEAYWLLMKDIPAPNQERKTFTVQIPKLKSLSTILWREVQDYVRHVTDEKLAWARAEAQQRRFAANKFDRQ